MNLEKKSESVFRYMEDGEMKERVDMVQYALTDGEAVSGDVYVYADHAELRLTIEGLSSIEEGMGRLLTIKDAFNAVE